MKTEIYSEPELELLTENPEEWIAACNELGLTNQLSLTSKETCVGPPYRFCDPRTSRIIVAICPRVVKLVEYKASTIPMDVLYEAKKCKENGWYDQLWVAYDDQSPDPFLIGEIKGKEKYSASVFHQIARWGDELLPWEELERKAIQRAKTGYEAAMKRLQRDCTLRLETIEEDVYKFFTDRLDEPRFDNPLINGFRGW